MKETSLFLLFEISFILMVFSLADGSRVTSSSVYNEKSKSSCQAKSCCLPKTSLNCNSSMFDPAKRNGVSIVCSSDALRCTCIDLMKTVIHSKLEQMQVKNCSLGSDVFLKKRLPVRYRMAISNTGFLKKASIKLSIRPVLKDPHADTKSCPLQKVSLNYLKLMEIPTNFFWACPGLFFIDLSHNHIYNIEETAFWIIMQHTSVNSLILDHNYIHSFGDDISAGLARTMKKTLTKQLSQVFGKGVRHHMSDICHVIGICSEKKLPTSAVFFDYIKNFKLFGKTINFDLQYIKSDLTLLSLNHNQLTRIPDSIFGLTKLTHLHLAYNKIRDTALNGHHYQIFKFIRGLKTLNLEGNQIKHLDSKTFYYLTSLVSLNLAFNKLLKLPPLLFKSLSSLVYLSLAGNTLSELTISARMGSLRLLNASHNFLHSLTRRQTKWWPVLETLDLSYNRISGVEAGTFTAMPHLLSVNLAGNLLHLVPADSFLTSARPMISDRVSLALFDRASGLRHSLMYHCDCRSVFNAISHEEKSKDVLYSFKYPKLLLPPTAAPLRCISGMNSVVPVAQNSNNYSLCAINDLACPRSCGCCHSRNNTRFTSVGKCSCTFRCLLGCRCYRTLGWESVRVTCSGHRFHFLPTSFAGRHGGPDEPALVTELRVQGADVKVLGSVEASPCPQGVRAVKVLLLTGSGLQRVHRNAFRCFPRLRRLSLAGNRIRALPSTPNLFSASTESLQMVDLSSNRLARLSGTPFSRLRSLARLNLASNPLLCDCAWEASFLRWAEALRSRGVFISLPPTCTPSADLRRYGGVAHDRVPFRRRSLVAACARMRSGMVAARRLWLSVGPSLALVLLAVVTAVLVQHYRFAVLMRVEERLRSPGARRLLRLPLAHARPIDVALVFHERQTREEHEVAEFIRSVGRDLEVRRVACCMPGALVASQLASLAGRVAVCVVFISRELLSDAALVQPLGDFLRRCAGSAEVDLVPILPAAEAGAEPLAQHPNFQLVGGPLAAVARLRWDAAHFWERLRLVLPPPRAAVAQVDDDVPLLDLRETPKIADMCVAAHADQLHIVRAIFERYRASLQLVHYRHSAVFGLRALGMAPPHSLLELCLGCRQVVLVASAELADDAEALPPMVACLRARLRCLAFPGSLVIVYAGGGHGLAHVLAEEGAADAGSVVHVGVDRTCEEKWLDALDAALACSLPAGRDRLAAEGMDEEEFDRLFVSDRTDVATDAADGEGEGRGWQEANEATEELLEVGDIDGGMSQPLLG